MLPISIILGEFEAEICFKRVKHARIRINQDRVIRASVPYFWSQSMAEIFLLSHEAWITKTMSKFQNLALNEDEVRILGQIYRLNFCPNFKRGLNTAPEILSDMLEKFEGEILIFGDRIFCENRLEFEKFKKFVARNLIGRYQPFVQKPVRKLTIRAMKTRWGSCNSVKGYINLSLNLVEKDIRFIEYVVLHELTHLIYPHHKCEFYDFIAGIMPDFKDRIKLVAH